MRRFPEKRVAVTGAGSGLGRTLALDFARLGWRVAASDLNRERAEETAALVNQAGGNGIAFQCDVAGWEAVENFAKDLVAAWGGVDVVINNAGVPAGGFFEKIPIADWKWIIDINLMGVIHGCKAFIPILKRQGGGHIANIGSSAGIVSMPEMAPYNVTKAGVISLSETLRVELAEHRIGVTVACPTFFKTNLMEQARFTDERQIKMASSFFDKSLCTAEDVSRHILRSIARNRLYALTQLDARACWRCKRFFPRTFYRIMGFVYRRKLMDRALGIQTEAN